MSKTPLRECVRLIVISLIIVRVFLIVNFITIGPRFEAIMLSDTFQGEIGSRGAI